MEKGAISIGIETIIIIAIAIMVLIFGMFFFYNYFVLPAQPLGNYTPSLNITLPSI